MNLRLLQLGDSALPIGGYSQSWGLEAAIDQGLVSGADDLEHWTRHWLMHASGPLEGVVASTCCCAAQIEDWKRVQEANELLEISLTPGTLRQASQDMGEQLFALSEAWPWAEASCLCLKALATSATRWHHAVVYGVLSAAAAGSPRDALAVYLHQAALGMISAGVRGIPIGHTHGQQILGRLQPDLEALAADLESRDLKTAGSTCPAYEILCHAQRQLYTRLFRS